ncbi:MAG TPA: hypothetical protein PKW96_09900 [Candidatus Aminicenantes bacterium]|nr:hypothetical protein [Candidatus Aminicenantes bacterium]
MKCFSSLMFPFQLPLVRFSTSSGENSFGFCPVSEAILREKWSISRGMSSRRSRRGGTSRVTTLRRKKRSSRKLPLPISSTSFLLVAATVRTSTLLTSVSPIL